MVEWWVRRRCSADRYLIKFCASIVFGLVKKVLVLVVVLVLNASRTSFGCASFPPLSSPLQYLSKLRIGDTVSHNWNTGTDAFWTASMDTQDSKGVHTSVRTLTSGTPAYCQTHASGVSDQNYPVYGFSLKDDRLVMPVACTGAGKEANVYSTFVGQNPWQGIQDSDMYLRVDPVNVTIDFDQPAVIIEVVGHQTRGVRIQTNGKGFLIESTPPQSSLYVCHEFTIGALLSRMPFSHSRLWLLVGC